LWPIGQLQKQRKCADLFMRPMIRRALNRV
jgi:hypothetical protein